MNLINELRELAEDLHVNGYNRYASAMSQAADELEQLRAKVDEIKTALRRHHEGAMGAGLDPSHSLTKLRVSAYQQSCLYADTADALEESK